MESPYENTQLRTRVLESCRRRDAGTGYNVQFRFCGAFPWRAPTKTRNSGLEFWIRVRDEMPAPDTTFNFVSVGALPRRAPRKHATLD